MPCQPESRARPPSRIGPSERQRSAPQSVPTHAAARGARLDGLATATSRNYDRESGCYRDERAGGTSPRASEREVGRRQPGAARPTAAKARWTATTRQSHHDNVDVLGVCCQGFEILGVRCNHGPSGFRRGDHERVYGRAAAGKPA
jgi:hypothetical protein